jgi:hypothetical protein
MNKSITRAAGAIHGEEMSPQAMDALIASLGRSARQRTTLYADAAADRVVASFAAAPLRPPPKSSEPDQQRTIDSRLSDFAGVEMGR